MKILTLVAGGDDDVTAGCVWFEENGAHPGNNSSHVSRNSRTSSTPTALRSSSLLRQTSRRLPACSHFYTALLLCAATPCDEMLCRRRSNDAELIEPTPFPNGSGGAGLTTAGRGSLTGARQTTDGDRCRDARPVSGDDGDDAAAATAPADGQFTKARRERRRTQPPAYCFHIKQCKTRMNYRLYAPPDWLWVVESIDVRAAYRRVQRPHLWRMCAGNSTSRRGTTPAELIWLYRAAEQNDLDTVLYPPIRLDGSPALRA